MGATTPRTGVIAGSIIAGIVILLAAATPSVAQLARPTALPAPVDMRVDRDRDRIFDDLEQQLAGRPQSDQLNVLVTLRAAASAERVRDIEHDVGDFALERRFGIVHAFAARASKRRIELLARNPSVLSVEPDSRATVANDDAQASFGVTKARLDLPSLDGDGDGDPSTYSPSDYVAAVIDTGIDAGHMDLDGGKVIGWHDEVNGGALPYDDDGHGTHVSATLAGTGDARPDLLYHGVAPAAALVGVKVLDANGGGSTSDIIAGVQWVVTNKALYGIEAINMSLRLPGCSNGTDALSTAVNNAQAAGLVVVVAAGNEGPGTCKIGTPSAATGALTVGAMADFGSNGFYQGFFSSRGPTADGRIKPDVSAPGVAITSASAGTVNGYRTEDGTSMAAPFVTGLALLMLDANPALTATDVKNKITSTAIDWARGGNNKTVGTTGPDIDYGYGRLDAYAALQSAGAALTTPPLPPVHDFREGTLSGTNAQINYALDVDDPTFPIAATMILPSINGAQASSPDFDLFLFDPNGNEVASSEFDTRQEELGYKPTVPGTYTLRVKSFNGSGGFFVDISRPVSPTYARPATATPLRVPLVPAYSECTTPNSTHVLPLVLPACDPPVLQSSQLKTSSLGRGSGFVRLKALPGNAATAADEADISITASATDVLRKADGTDFTGLLPLRATLRITDRANGFFQNEAATTADVPFSVPVSCVGTAGPAGGTCSVSTTADTLVPGVAREGKRALLSALSIALLDRGADDTIDPPSGTCPPTCGSGDEQPFLTEGVFEP